MLRKTLGTAALVAALSAGPLWAHDLAGQMVLNGDVTATLATPQGRQQVTGRMSGYLTLPAETLEKGARVEELNVALFGVEQSALTGREMRRKPTGVVGFSVAGEGEDRQRLRYDPANRALVGTLQGRLDMPQLYEMAELRIDTEDDIIELPRVPATLEVRIEMGEIGSLAEAREKPVERPLRAAMTLSARESADLQLRPIDLRISARHVETQIVFIPWLEVARRLCIQPVRILSLAGGWPFPFFQLSGDGLAFGQPGAAAQWAKADVVFTYRDWITLFKSQYSTFSSGEAGALLAEVDVDDCIEVFFVDRFSPQAQWGGGATFGLGLASSKVISSDENADFGVDLTHLAHELGHVLSLGHPPGNSSTNTLMCPSGFNNDNPKRNSQQNKNNASNPLLTFALKVKTPGPDCQGSGDCGACP